MPRRSSDSENSGDHNDDNVILNGFAAVVNVQNPSAGQLRELDRIFLGLCEFKNKKAKKKKERKGKSFANLLGFWSIAAE